MVARAGGYFGMPFKGYLSITRGGPLSPKIFNVVVDAVIRYWVALVAPTKDGMEGLGLSIQDLVVYLYADGVFVASIQTARLQTTFDALSGLFEQVRLLLNERKTVSMACRPCHAPGQMSSEAYGRGTEETGPTFWERQQRRLT